MSKLTLSVDGEVVARAKKFAKQNHTSVSQLVETFLSLATKPEKKAKRKTPTPLLDSLRGIVKDDGLDYREEYHKYLAEKYR